MTVDENGEIRLPSGITVGWSGDLITVWRSGVWSSHPVSRFTADEAVEVSEAIVVLLNWGPGLAD